MIRVATDIGGTFTDLVAFNEETGRVELSKASSTPQDLAQGILSAVDMSSVTIDDVSYFVHGCTVVINAVTERVGAKTALVTTAGFRDILEIGRGNRPDMYNLRFQKPRPFVPRHLRFEVRERVNRRGEVLIPLDLSGLVPIVERCQAEGVAAVAICLLHSYAYPEHEQQVADALGRLLPGVPVTASSDITQEWREYERTNTAVLNAYVMPVVQQYLDRLEVVTGERGLVCPLHIMQSNGGTASFRMARRRPIFLIESGPAAGVMGAAAIGRSIGETNMISLDIGGTTAKCSLIEGGEPKTTTEYRVEWTPLFPGYPVKVPVVDIVEIGTGGGSIAWFDDDGRIKIGPKSAGADPGPACYGLGGIAPTVTDAKLVAGVINPNNFLGGRLQVSLELARKALGQVADKLGTTIERAANGIIRIVNANMVEQLKLVSVRRGYDPRDFALVAFGGGGAMHAAALAQELHFKKVVVPRYPGHFSAWGMLVTQPRVDVVKTRVSRSRAIGAAEVEAYFVELGETVRSYFAQDGEGDCPLILQRKADLRYHGQEHTVTIPICTNSLSVSQIETDFHDAHERLYTFRMESTPIEFVNFHVAGFLQVRTPDIVPWDSGGSARGDRLAGLRLVDFDLAGVHETAVYNRDQLPAGFTAAGPLIVEEPASSTLVHPGQSLMVDYYGNLEIHLKA